MNSSAPTPIEVDCQAVKRKLDAGEKFLFIDCREPEEHAIARLPDARLIPMNEIPGRIDELAEYRGKEVVIHCHHGGRSLRVAQWLRSQGFERAQSMAGGIDEWATTIDPSLPRY